MTVEAMRDAIERIYGAALVVGDAAISFPADVPCGACSGVTPQSWFVPMAVEAAEADTAEFGTGYAEPVGAALAAEGLRLGLTSFGHLRMEDRPAVQVINGAGVQRRRERQFIVHALGWKGKE